MSEKGFLSYFVFQTTNFENNSFIYYWGNPYLLRALLNGH